MGSLLGRRVLITGGTAGIGRATAASLAGDGASVFVVGRNRTRLDQTCADLKINGGTSDVRDYQACENVVAKAAQELGGLDAVINCAGIGTITSIEEMTAQAWSTIMETNVTGTFNICKAALPWLKASDRADIINLGSRAGRYAYEGGTAYCASKFAIQGFSEALFLDLVQYGIGVSLVAPGTVGTGFSGIEPQDWHLRPEDVAEAIANCLKSHATANLNWIEMRPSRRRQTEDLA